MRNLLVFVSAMLLCQTVFSAEPEQFGTVDDLAGSATVSDTKGTSSKISVGQKIYPGQTISTAADGEVHIVSEDGGIIAIRPNTVFRVDAYQADGTSSDKIFMSLLKGAIRSITGWIGKINPSGYVLTTPSGTIGIRGTDHEATVIDSSGGDAPGTYDTVTEGSTILKTSQGETDVTPGKFAFAPRNRKRAPYFLARRPHFLAMRRLRIEGRLQQRKMFLRSHLKEMREKRIERIRNFRRGNNRSSAPNRPRAGRQMSLRDQGSQRGIFRERMMRRREDGSDRRRDRRMRRD